MLITRATIKDLDIIADFIKKLCAERSFDDIFFSYDEAGCKQYLNNMLQESNFDLLVVKTAAGIVIGTFGITLTSIYFNPSNIVAHGMFCYIQPEYRGKGIAEAMLNAFELVAKVNGASHVIVDVYPGTKLQSFYNKHDYKPIDKLMVKEV